MQALSTLTVMSMAIKIDQAMLVPVMCNQLNRNQRIPSEIKYQFLSVYFEPEICCVCILRERKKRERI